MDKWCVFIDGKYSRCVAWGTSDVRMLFNEGWQLIWDDAPSRLDGWIHAAIEHQCFAEDYDDRYRPIALSEPTVLFRSVSIPELIDIYETGSVLGGRSFFNEYEFRPWVFFSPEPNENCIGRGEDITAQANFAAVKELKALGVDFHTADGRKALSTRYREILNGLQEKREDAIYTSAVIKTVPIAMGLHYSTEHGQTGMNGDDEYGLFPGQVRAEHIDEVMWVRGGEIIDKTDAKDRYLVDRISMMSQVAGHMNMLLA